MFLGPAEVLRGRMKRRMKMQGWRTSFFRNASLVSACQITQPSATPLREELRGLIDFYFNLVFVDSTFD